MLFRYVIVVACLWGCGSASNNAQIVTDTVQAMASSLPEKPHALFKQVDAEKILGEPARLTDSSTSTVADTVIFQSSYTAVATDKKSGKTGNVYFIYEQYSDASTAHYLLDYYKIANEKNGAKNISNIGDEAWFHTDGQNFYFIMARKGNKLMRMKVNKVTSNTSLDAFNAAAKDLLSRM